MSEVATDRLIDDRAVASAFSIGRSTVRQWVDRGLIPRPVVARHKFTRWSERQIQERIEELKQAEKQEAAS